MKQTKPVRIYHPWTKWECYKAGFFETSAPEGMDADEAQLHYCYFLKDLKKFGDAMARVFKEWPHSCEQFLTNPTMNRIAWLGQASMCITSGIPSTFRGGFKLLTPEEQDAANRLAEQYLNMYLENLCIQQTKSGNI